MFSDESVMKAFGMWQERRRELEAQSRALEAALEQYASGDGPEPTQQRQRVSALRQECDELFRQVLDTVEAARRGGA